MAEISFADFKRVVILEFFKQVISAGGSVRLLNAERKLDCLIDLYEYVETLDAHRVQLSSSKSIGILTIPLEGDLPEPCTRFFIQLDWAQECLLRELHLREAMGDTFTD